METNVKYTIAGTFVLILFGFIILSVIWLSSGFSTEAHSYYQINMNEAISGLSKDGPVEFNGVEVGTVDQIKINKANMQLIELTIKVKSDTPITFGTRAKLGMHALSGIAYILLEDHGEDKRPLVAQAGQVYPIIPTKPSLFLQLDTLLSQINTSFTQLSTSIQSLLNKKNLDSIDKLLDASKKSMHLIETETLPAATKTMRSIDKETIPEANKALRAIQIETIPETTKALRNFNAMSEDLSHIATEIKEDPAILIRGKTQSEELGPGEQ